MTRPHRTTASFTVTGTDAASADTAARQVLARLGGAWEWTVALTPHARAGDGQIHSWEATVTATRLDDHDPELVLIADLAAETPTTETIHGDVVCVLCDTIFTAETAVNPHAHDRACPWRRAREHQEEVHTDA